MPALSSLDLAGVARFLLSPECKSVSILTGAGVSVAAGIPDFRSPGGMYSTLRPELITATPAQRARMAANPTAVVEKSMWFENPFPYLEVRRPFILGTRERKWKATLSHRFFELLHAKGKLTRLYTQNIDGLDYQLALPPSSVVPVHGSIGQVACEACGHAHDFDVFCERVATGIKDIYKEDATAPAESSLAAATCDACGRPAVKPTTVLFGASLPRRFFESAQADLPTTDLLIVAGTSLVVSPANSLVYSVPESTVRLIVNNEPVGAELGVEYGDAATRDVFGEGDCDDVCLELMRECGWLEELRPLLPKLPEASRARLEAALA